MAKIDVKIGKGVRTPLQLGPKIAASPVMVNTKRVATNIRNNKSYFGGFAREGDVCPTEGRGK